MNRIKVADINEKESAKIEYISETLKSLYYLRISIDENEEYSSKKEKLKIKINEDNQRLVDERNIWWKNVCEKYAIENVEGYNLIADYLRNEIYKINGCASCY